MSGERGDYQIVYPGITKPKSLLPNTPLEREAKKIAKEQKKASKEKTVPQK